jgi:hypothetical protein
MGGIPMVALIYKIQGIVLNEFLGNGKPVIQGTK